MKNINNTITLLLFIALSVAAGCKKDPVMYAKGIETFKFIVKNAQGAEKEYPGTIAGDEIVVNLPIEVDVTDLKASFTVDNPRTIVQVGSVVQESGISEQDFTNTISYRVKAEDKSTRSYKVRVEKQIAIQSFGFFKEDNQGLLEGDYKAAIRGLTIDIDIPESVDLTKLVARFQTTTGATLKVGAVAQESQKTVNNFSSNLIYTFSAAGLSAALDFTAKISFIGAQWWMIGDKTIIGSEATDVKMAIHPFTKQPYLAYIRTGKNESGAVIPANEKKIAVIALNGTTWKNIGSTMGISDDQVDIINIAFDEEGTPYVGYKDYLDALQKATVLKYTNDSWTAVGPKNFSPMRVDKFSFTVGENNQPLIGASTFTAITGYLKRAIYASNYTNKWNDITPAIANNLIGGVQVFKGSDGKSYMAVLDRNSNFSMYKFSNNTWTPVGPIGFRTSDGLPGYTSVIGAASVNGTVYIGFQTVSANQRLNRIMKFNGTSWEELGSAGNSQDQSEKYALAIAPDGKLYFGFANTTGLYVRTFNDNTKNWNTPRLVFSGKINTFDLQVASDGIPYLAVSPSSDNKVIVYKYSTTK